MKTLLCLFAILACTSVMRAQPELANPFLCKSRTALNTVKSAGDWTWFTMDGALYRKHVDRPDAELWYKAVRGTNSSKEFVGLLLAPSKLAHHEVFTSMNSSLPSSNLLLKIDEEGTVWFSNCNGTVAAFDGIQWRVTMTASCKRKYTETWHMTPFGADSAYPKSSIDFRADDNLLKSIPGYDLADARHSRQSPKAVYHLDVHANGNVYIATDDGVHVFRPLAEGETKRGEPSPALAPYPNPSSSYTTFAMKNGSANTMSVDVRDITGRLRLQNIEGMSTGTVVDVTGLEEGVYVAVLRSNGATATTTFTVRR